MRDDKTGRYLAAEPGSGLLPGDSQSQRAEPYARASIFMSIRERFNAIFGAKQSADTSSIEFIERQFEMMKATMPEWMYNTPFGVPRKVNLAYLRRLAKSPYVFMAVSTIADQVASVKWEIQPIDKESTGPEVQAHIEEVTEFFNNPNGNDESFPEIVRKATRDVLEVNSGVVVKVFDRAMRLTGLMAYDGATFTKNPDMHGSLSEREDIIPVLPQGTYTKNAAYYQYGWFTPNSYPVPFGKKEIIWLDRNNRTDNLYGMSPVEILADVIQALVYGSTWHLEYFSKNEIPVGVISLIGSSGKNLKAFRERFRRQLIKTDAEGDKRRYFHTIPVTNEEVKFTQFQFDAAQLQLIESQKWFLKIAAACFGVTPSELGFTEDINRATDLSQSRIHKRKAIKPLLEMWEYAMNMSVIPEFGYDDIKFSWIQEDLEEEVIKTRLDEARIKIGVITINEARERQGLEPVEWGDEPPAQQAAPGGQLGLPMPGGYMGTGQEENMKKRHPKKTGQKAMTLESGMVLNPGEAIDMEKVIKRYFAKKEEDIIKELMDIYDNDVISKIKSKAGKEAEIKTRWDSFMGRLKDMFNADAIKIAVMEAVKKEFQKGLEKAEKDTDMNFIINAHVLDFLKNHTFENVKDANDQTAAKLRGEFERAIMNGEGIKEIRDRVKGVFEVADNRAEMIARTESNRIMNVGAVEGYKQSGLPGKKEWIAKMDDRTSDICRSLDGQSVDINNHFESGGQKFLYPPAHVNCRSTVIFKPD